MDEDTHNIKTSVIITLAFSIVSAIIAIVSYVASSKWKCCCHGEKSLLDIIIPICKCKKEDASYSAVQEMEEDKPPLCNSANFVSFVAALHVFSKAVIVVANIVYLVVVKKPDQPSLTSKQELGRNISYMLTYFGSIYEIVYIFIVPIYIVIFWHCYNITKSTYCSSIRNVDLHLALLVSPFVSVHLHYIGDLYWIFIIVRLFFYCTTFVAVVIVGIRFMIGIGCFKIVDMACCSKGEAVEIRDCKHLFKDIGLQLVSLMVKLNTGSSALATYFKVGITQDGPVQTAYIVFTLLSCFNAVAGLLYNSILLRWIVMKADNKADDSTGSRTLEFLKVKVPSSHISFALSVCINGGLIGLNSYILYTGTYQLNPFESP